MSFKCVREADDRIGLTQGRRIMQKRIKNEFDEIVIERFDAEQRDFDQM